MQFGAVGVSSMSPCMCGDAQCSTFDADVSAMDQSESCAQNALCSGTASDGRWALLGSFVYTAAGPDAILACALAM